MRLLVHDDLPSLPAGRVFRHSPVAGFALLAIVGLPAVGVACCAQRIGASFEALPWFFWVVGGPLMFMGFLLWLLVLQTASHAAQSGLLATNWVLRVAPSGCAIQLRSFRNSHFPRDVPTVLWLESGEIRCARRVQETGWIASSKGRRLVRSSWLELELQGVDCAPIEMRLAQERAEQGPPIRVLGIKTRTRFNDTPAFFVRPGVLRVEWLGAGMLAALRETTEIAPDLKVDLDQELGTQLEPRVKAYCDRGWQIAAHALVQRERGLSWSEAKKFVEEVGRKAA